MDTHWPLSLALVPLIFNLFLLIHLSVCFIESTLLEACTPYLIIPTMLVILTAITDNKREQNLNRSICNVRHLKILKSHTLTILYVFCMSVSLGHTLGLHANALRRSQRVRSLILDPITKRLKRKDYKLQLLTTSFARNNRNT